MTNNTKLKLLVDRVLMDRRFCGDENHKALADGIQALIAESQSMSGLLKRFVDGEYEQDENQAERHMYFTEAQSLLALVSGELEAHTIVPDSAIKAIHAERDLLKAENEALRKNSDRYQWLRDKSESVHQFYLSTPIWFTGVKFSKENVDRTIDTAMGNGEQS